MKDEELFKAWKSEQYKDQSTEERLEFVEHLHIFPKYFEQAFLAGLKAGRPQWHKVADGDLPKESKKYYVYSEEWGVEVRKFLLDAGCFECRNFLIIAWKEIVLPELPKESE